MPAPFRSPCLAVLLAEVNARWPGRDRASDGWIGDAAHRTRVSDHNPDPDGSVDAIDIDKDGIDVPTLLAAVVGDRRVSYVIWSRRIWTPAAGWRPYTGDNPHTAHVHVSCTDAGQNDTRPWGLLPAAPTTTQEEEMPETPETKENVFEIRKYLGIMERNVIAAIDRGFEKVAAAVREAGK